MSKVNNACLMWWACITPPSQQKEIQYFFWEHPFTEFSWGHSVIENLGLQWLLGIEFFLSSFLF